MIFSLLAKSNARSNGILAPISIQSNNKWKINVPHALQVHRPNFDHMTDLFAFQDAITATTGHSSHVEQLGTVDHVVVYVISIFQKMVLTSVLPSLRATQTPLASI